MGSIDENLAATMLLNGGKTPGGSPPAGSAAYVANLSDDILIITALLPSDSTTHRNLVLAILDKDDLTRPDGCASVHGTNRERSLKPGEVAMFDLKTPPTANHVSLFRLRRESQASSSFLKYIVEVKGRTVSGTITQLGTQHGVGKVEKAFPHLLYVW